MRNKFTLLALCLSCIAAIGVTAYNTYVHSYSVLAAKTATADTKKTTDSTQATTLSTSTLASNLEKIIASHNDISTAISIVNIDSGQQINAGLSNTVFRGASTTKVLTAAAYLHAVEQGNATLEQHINGDTASSLIQRMIEDSDNNAWYALNDYLGYDELQTYGDNIGMASWTAYPNTLTTSDEAILLKKLYQGDLLNASHTSLLLSHMKNSDNQNLIAAALPASATVYHKYGALEGELHDAAIIKYNGQIFVIVIFTNNELESLEDYSGRSSYIQELTSAVMNAF